jgi:hypothetical protein
MTQPATTNLPAPFADSAGVLDVDGLRALAGSLRADLIDALRASVTQIRETRGNVVVPEDTHDLVRRLVDAGEVLRRVADCLLSTAAEADALVEEEAVTLYGEDVGVPRNSLFVPDGEGQRIAVRADWKSGASTWDVPSLVGWVIEEEVAEQAAAKRAEVENLDRPAEAADLAWYESDAQTVAHEVVLRLLTLGRYTPSVTAINALRTRLSEKGRDADAAVIGQLRSISDRTYLGVKITREAIPKSQRGA